MPSNVKPKEQEQKIWQRRRGNTGTKGVTRHRWGNLHRWHTQGQDRHLTGGKLNRMRNVLLNKTTLTKVKQETQGNMNNKPNYASQTLFLECHMDKNVDVIAITAFPEDLSSRWGCQATEVTANFNILYTARLAISLLSLYQAKLPSCFCSSKSTDRRTVSNGCRVQRF